MEAIVWLASDVVSDNSLSAKINNFARQWMETKYLSYLQDDSEEKTQLNIIKLIELSQKY